MKFRHLLFDLDGTLTDPFLGITRSVRHSLRHFGIEAELEDLKPFIGPPLVDSYMEFYGFSRGKAEEAVVKYREYYRAGGIFMNRVYDGIPGLLAGCRERGQEVILATSKSIVFAEQILDKFALRQYFDAAFGCELDGTRVKKGEVIDWAIENHKMDKAAAVMIGDRLHDIHGAHENGIPAIGVMWGYGSEAELREAGADAIAHSLDELEMLI